MTDASNNPAKPGLAGLSLDFFLGLAIALVGALLLLWLIPAQINDAGSFGLPPSLAPKALAWIMLICGGVLAAQNLRSSSTSQGPSPGEIGFLMACLVATSLMLIIMAYVGEMFDQPNMGFLIAAPLGLIAFTFLHSRAPIWAYAFNAIMAPLIIIAVFWWGLELPLP